MEKTWQIHKPEKKIVDRLAKELGVSHIIAHLLVIRGIHSFDAAKLFFRPQLDHLHDPFLMKDMSKAINRIKIALEKKQKVLVYGDYDVDGTTSVSMMYLFFKKLTQKVEYYIPCRYKEGYGISLTGIDYAKKNNFNLIIALDCGITAVDQVDYANTLNIDIIICDHHNPDQNIPNASAILNPKQNDCNYPYKDLSGCGVGFKLIQAYCQKNMISINEIKHYLDLVAISIGADIVPMTGENRVLAFYGLKELNKQKRKSLRALMKLTSKHQNFNMSDVVFKIAPRINAAGRMQHAKNAVALLIEQNDDKIDKLIALIERNNDNRRKLDKLITSEALTMIAPHKRSTVVFSPKWHKGVVGIVASRLIETHYRPTIVFAEENGLLTGSARSVHGFDIYNAISKCSHLCVKFGGHKYAAGLSIKKENIIPFTKAFEDEVSKKISNEQLQPKIAVDMQIELNDITQKLFRIIKQFAPFGPKNLSPIFLTKSVFDNGLGKPIGQDGSHLKININTDIGSISGIGFGFGDFFQKIKQQKKFDICYSINENFWNGKTTLQLMLSDIKEST